MTVSDLMREDVVTAGPETPVDEVAVTMREENVGSVVVTDGAVPVGIVTDRDVAVRIAADRLDAAEMSAGAVMSEDLVTVGSDAGVMSVCQRMYEEGVRRMPVVDDDELVGIVTFDDLTVLLSGELVNLAGVVEAEAPPY